MKNIKNVIFPTFALTLICAILGAALSLTNNLTKDTIAQQQEEKKKAAFQVALPATDYEFMSEKNGCTMYAAHQGLHVGYVVSSSANGYGGKIEVMVGLDLSGKIYNIEIVSCSDETAGIGQKVQDEKFRRSFNDKTKQEIDSVDVITGATISSNAVKEAVKTAIEFYESEVDRNELA